MFEKDVYKSVFSAFKLSCSPKHLTDKLFKDLGYCSFYSCWSCCYSISSRICNCFSLKWFVFLTEQFAEIHKVTAIVDGSWWATDVVGTTNIVENPVVHVSINFMKSIITKINVFEIVLYGKLLRLRWWSVIFNF